MNAPAEDLLNAKQVAKILNISLPFVYKLAATGQLPPVKFGADDSCKAVRFEYDDLVQFIKDHKINGRG
jgi:excisionase family DNA binding protein